jgi:hypothetical protein
LAQNPARLKPHVGEPALLRLRSGQVLKSKGLWPPLPTKSFVLIMRLFLLSIMGKESIMPYIIFCDGVKKLSHAIGDEAAYDPGVQ